MFVNITYYVLFLFAIALVAIMPFPVMYQFSNFMAFVFRRVLKYRLLVVRKNLKNSFPEKSNEELLRIEKDFYKNLIDVSIETLKGFSMTKKQLNRRYRILNPEFFNEYFEKGVSIIGVTGHLNNWEWGALVAGLQLKHKSIAFYKQLENPFIDKLLKRSREKKGTILVNISETENYFEATKGNKSLYILVADQSPSNLEKSFWVNFLNQETACLHGPEKYTHLYNYPLVFINIKRVKRGFYTVYASLLSENPKSLKPGEVTQIFMNKLEDVIKEEPTGWLWSHRRWKIRKRENYHKYSYIDHNPW